MPDRRRVDASRYSMQPRPDVPRSAFDISHTHKTTFDSGWLNPIFIQEILPGDTMRVSLHALCRLATPVVPVMDNLYLETFFFFVPNRLVWDNFKRFMGEQNDPNDTTEFLVPTVGVPPYANIGQPNNSLSGLADYFGIINLAALGGPEIPVNALPFRAYNLIYNEWFRDEDLQVLADVPKGDGPDGAIYGLLRRGKRHDYFTSARPWPQKPDNQISFGSTALNPLGRAGSSNFTLPRAGVPVMGIGVKPGATAGGATLTNVTGGRQYTFGDTFQSSYNGALETSVVLARQGTTGFPDVRVLINDIRTANAIQVMGEKMARGGSRYTEIVRTVFGVTSPDARLQRPEYLGGGRSVVSINPVVQTSASEINGSTTVLGELAGVGTAVVRNHGFSQSFTEHGYVIGLANVRADMTYQQGINRMWLRRTRYDFYWPAFAHLGEQAIMSREIYADGSGNNTGQAPTTTGDFSTFGFQERYGEYRFMPNRASGRFRSASAQTLDFWHFGQNFSLRPVLNSQFIQEDPPVERVLQVGGAEFEEFLFDGMFNVRMARCMPMFSIPGLGPRL